MNNMEIVAFSDTHNDHANLQLRHADIAIHAGDAGIKGNYTEIRSFLEWYVKQPFKYKIYVPGNHDSRMYSSSELQSLAQEYGIHVLFNDTIIINELVIHGNATTFPSEDRIEYNSDLWEKKKVAWSGIPNNCDILITHIPPYGILDESDRGANIGCSELKKLVDTKSPKMHIFGHCHEKMNHTLNNGRTTFMNVCCKDRNYFTTNVEGKRFEL